MDCKFLGIFCFRILWALGSSSVVRTIRGGYYYVVYRAHPLLIKMGTKWSISPFFEGRTKFGSLITKFTQTFFCNLVAEKLLLRVGSEIDYFFNTWMERDRPFVYSTGRAIVLRNASTTRTYNNDVPPILLLFVLLAHFLTLLPNQLSRPIVYSFCSQV